MQRPSRSRLPASRKARPAGFRWLLALLTAGAIAWVWWQSRQRPEPPSAAPAAAATNRPAAGPTTAALPPAVTIRTTAPPVRPLPTNPPPGRVVTTAPPPVLIRTNLPPVAAGAYPRRVQNVFEAQLALARQALSPGSLDGVMGAQTRSALRVFQEKLGLSPTGELDADTQARLVLDTPPLTAYIVTSNDLARLQPLPPTWLGKSEQSALDYETILELVAEKGRAHPNLIRRLNPGLDWSSVSAGTTVQIPDVRDPNGAAKAALIEIHLATKTLEVFDAETNLLGHFPCSIAQRVEKRPIGELHVAVIAPHPNYTFDPEVFPESAEARELNRKLVLPPGPNNPVGVAWIGLDRPGYGIHGTPNPEQVGRTESHGCFRLANWNAEYLLQRVWIGMPVRVAP